MNPRQMEPFGGKLAEHCVVRTSSPVQISLCKASLGSVTPPHVTQVSAVVFSDKLSKGRIRQSPRVCRGGSLTRAGEVTWLYTEIQEQLFLPSRLGGQKIAQSYQSWDIWCIKVCSVL